MRALGMVVCVPVVLAIREAEARSLEPRNLKPAWKYHLKEIFFKHEFFIKW
jgi:hypothetical protein